MAEMGHGYGSEWHLLRYLGRHRADLDLRVLDVVGGDSIDWLDFDFDPATWSGDRELRGLGFLPASDEVQVLWSATWPRTGNPPNWDAVGKLRNGDTFEWLLVEAKANIEEIESTCGAKGGGRALIDTALRATKHRLGVDPSRDWMSGYYQYANRLAVLDFLCSSGRQAHLVCIYFIGDSNGERTCPADEAGWREALGQQDLHLDIADDHPLAARVHKVFLPVNAGTSRRSAERLASRSFPAAPSRVSVADLMKDFIGVVDSGVTDLATNPKYMEGFGEDPPFAKRRRRGQSAKS